MATSIKFRPLTGILIALAVLFVVAGLIYFTKTAGDLPAFFPGHQVNSAHKHTKHGLAMFGLAALSLVGAWFTTSPDRADRPAPPSQ